MTDISRYATNTFLMDVIRNVGSGICVCHEIDDYPYLRFTIWNDRMEELTGYTMEDMNAEGWYQSVYPDPKQQAKAVERMRRMRAGENLLDEEWVITTREREKRILSITTSIVTSEDNVPHILAVMNEITTKKQTEGQFKRYQKELEEKFGQRTGDLLEEVSRRKRIEGDLRRSELRLSRALQGSNDAFWEWYDIDRDMVWVSDRFYEILGYEPGSITFSRQLLKSQIHPDYLGLVRSALQEHQEDGKDFDVECRIKHTSGGYICVRIRGEAWRDENGKPLGMAGSMQDITAAKEAEAKLKKSEETLRSAQSAARIGSWWYDPGAGRLRWTEEMFRILGLDPQGEAPHYDAYRKIIHPDDRQRFDAAFTGAVQEGIGYDLELQIIRPDGTFGYVHSICKPVKDKEGKVVKLLGTTQDITERKKIQERYSRQNAEFRAIFNSITDAIVFVDTDRKIAMINPAFTAIFGYTLEDVAGRTTRIIYAQPEEFERQGRERYHKEAEVGTPVYEVEYRRKDGSVFPSETLGIPVKDEENNIVGFIGVIRDISKRREQEEETDLLRKQWQQAQKMEAIGTLAGGIAHDFNNILAAIFGYVEMAKDDAVPGSQLESDLDEVLLAAGRAKDLVEQILAFSRQSEGEPVILKIQPLVKEVLKMLRSSIPTTIRIMEDIDPGTGPVRADPTHIHQIIMNLCTNAYHAMETTGGELTVTVQKVFLTDEREKKSALPPGEYVELAVVDTGCGIGPDLIDRIFDPYFTTKESGKGTGMGLAVIHGIIADYGGDIIAESIVGKGSTFRVYLPVHTGESRPDESERKGAATGRERILFIDDEKVIAQLGKTMLERLGYTVTEKQNGFEALDVFRRSPRDFDLVITDQTMPGLTGYELARRMLKIRPDIRIILCTGYSSQVDEEAAKGAGISEFAYKPLRKEVMARLIREVLDTP